MLTCPCPQLSIDHVPDDEDERRRIEEDIRDVERDAGEVERQEELRDSGRGGW